MVLFAGAAQAQVKVGYINSAAILSEMPEVQQMRSNLEGFSTQLRKKGQQLVTQYQQKEQEAMQKEERGELSPLQKQQIIEELQKMQQEILAFEQEMQTKVVAKEQELLEPILDRVDTAIKSVAGKNGYAYVFDLSSGAILYANESNDITNLVKAEL